VTVRQVGAQISRRAERAGLPVSAALTESLQAYLALLAKWNRKINLTSLDVDPPTDEAIDRLIVEPLVGAQLVRPGDRLVIDVGSGGGSPAIPFKLAAPQLRSVMVEVKTRKSAFLREAVRQLALHDTVVEMHLVQELLPRVDLHEAADLVTVRAVRMDLALLGPIQSFLRPAGRVIWFGGLGAPSEAAALASAGLRVGLQDPVSWSQGRITVLVRQSK
jgi:16S rRNA (guanine527-N7)-methyltransferase